MGGARIPLLAVDGGGTKCLAVFAEEDARIVGMGRAGSCNYQGIGEEAASRELAKAIRQAMNDVSANHPALSSAEPWNVDCAVFGLAGLDTEHDREVIVSMVEGVLRQLHIRVNHLVVENDGFAALLGATNGEPGILVIAGTGSIAYGVNRQGITARSGGWGHRVGDEGSGYWIGKRAITAVLKASDGRGEPTALAGRLLPYLGLRQVEELFNWTYGSTYSVEKVAELSPLVSQAAAEGDAVAKKILLDASEELFLAARAVIDKLAMSATAFKMILQGGVLQNDERVRAMVVERVLRHAPQVQIDKAQNDPIYGVIAKGLALLRERRNP
jgi:N-acetylglucosamine kinase-like BadF-type ATPase